MIFLESIVSSRTATRIFTHCLKSLKTISGEFCKKKRDAQTYPGISLVSTYFGSFDEELLLLCEWGIVSPSIDDRFSK